VNKPEADLLSRGDEDDFAAFGVWRGGIEETKSKGERRTIEQQEQTEPASKTRDWHRHPTTT
jgi:hypothetical protein